MPAGGPIWVGASYNPQLARDILGATERFDHLAMSGPPRPEDRYFAEIPSHFVLLVHDLHETVGPIADPIDATNVERARELVALLRAPWAVLQIRCSSTEPLDLDIDHPLPPVYSVDMLERLTTQAKALAERIGAPLVLENVPNLLDPGPGELTEARFLKQLLAETGCGLALNLAHVWLTAHYRAQSPMDLLETFPLEPVVELRLASMSPDPDLEGPWIGAGPVGTELLEMAGWAIERAPRLRAITYEASSRAMTAPALFEAIDLVRNYLRIPSPRARKP